MPAQDLATAVGMIGISLSVTLATWVILHQIFKLTNCTNDHHEELMFWLVAAFIIGCAILVCLVDYGIIITLVACIDVSMLFVVVDVVLYLPY